MTPVSSTSRFERWLLVGALGPVLVALVADSFVQGRTEVRLSVEAIEAEARTLSNLSASYAEAPVEFEDKQALSDLLSRIAMDHHFAFAFVFDAHGAVLDSRGDPAQAAARLALVRELAPGEVQRFDDVMVASTAIGTKNPPPRLVLGLSTVDAEAAIRRRLVGSMAMDALASAISLAVVAWLVRAIRRRNGGLLLQREMLRQTGRMAKVGGWELKMPEGRFSMSEEARALLALDAERASELMKAIALQQRALVNCLDTGQPFDLELEVQVAGAARWMRVQGEAERAEGQTVRVFGAIQDVTEQRHAREAALDASRAKSQFLANTSHELRTPLNGIIGMTELSLEGTLSLEQRGYLESVLQSGRTMLSIINDLLDIARIEAGKFTIEVAPVQLDEVVASAARSLTATAQRKGLSLVVGIPSGLALRRQADPLRVTQIVTNLLGNALKFTEAGEIEVRLAPGATPDEVRISVRDTGLGIPAARLEAIFEAFTQSDGSTTRRFGGTGLGLTITRELARLMGGDVSVTSTEGVGSTFTARLHLPALPEAAPPPRLSRRLLLVDGLDSAALATREVLERLGITSVRASSVPAAIEQLERAAAPFDGALVDSALDGATELRAELERRGLEVIQLVPFGVAVRKGRSIARPLCVRDVLQALEPSSNVTPMPQGARSPAHRLRVLLAEDNAVNATLARRLIERAHHEVVHVWDGKAAVTAALAEPFDLVLMDVQMPELDGLEATRRIRAEETSSGRHLPIFAMTANAMSADEVQCLAAGMDGFIPKPIELAKLRALLEALSTTKAA